MNTIIVDSKGQIENAAKTNEKANEKKANNLPVSKEFNDEKKEETKKPEAASGAKTAKQPKGQAEAKKANSEQPKPKKPALNLDSVLKLIEDLNRKKIHRDRLRLTIDTLEEFEVELKDDAEETDSNYYTGCHLTIADDNRNEFKTKNPFIIQAVAHYVKNLCVERLEEIEAEIVLPQ